MNTNDDDLKKEDSVPSRKLRHDINNQLAIIGSFLTLCQTVEHDEIFKACLKNAEMSYREIIEVLGRKM